MVSVSASYSKGKSIPLYGSNDVLSDGSISLAAVASITGICNGSLPSGTNTTTTFAFGVPAIKLDENRGLYNTTIKNDDWVLKAGHYLNTH